MNSDAPILLVDDERVWLDSLELSLQGAGFRNCTKISDARSVLPLLQKHEFAVVVLDLKMPHLSGENLLPDIVSTYPHIPVIILSGIDQVETAVQCMRQGAFDFFVKTGKKESLFGCIRHALSLRSLERENREIKKQLLQGGLKKPQIFSEFCSSNPKMLAIFQYVEAIASSDEPVLIAGESGVGKELIAQAVHHVSRGGQPMVAVNVAGLDDNMFSDTLFGHQRGAFTGAERDREGLIEKAAGGTLFLDEIGDLSPLSQVKLLRLLQEGEYFPLGSDKPKYSDVRIVCATNHDLAHKQAKGSFRSDLFYRLKSHYIEIPPLRERPEDLPLLFDKFLRAASQKQEKKLPTVPDEIHPLLANYSFPGNVRELRALVFDAVSLHRGGKLSIDVFRQAFGVTEKTEVKLEKRISSDVVFPKRLPTLTEIGVNLVQEALRRTGGNQTQAAGMLGISRQALGKRLKNMRLQGL